MNIRNLAIASVSMLSLATPAFAQESAAEDNGGDEDIVVTGTLIRGIAPGGSQAIAVGQDKIESIGATNTSDLIASVPQAGNFLSFVGIRGSTNFSLAVNRPSLRYLGNISSSSASTLLLVDGRRLPGMGILQSSGDLDAIAAGAIERVDIITDGGSSTYGSDAVGGVMNFITRKRIDGVEAKGSVGFADNYTAYNLGLAAGINSDTVSAYVAYDFSKHDELFGYDLDWSQSRDWVNNVGADSACEVGNIRVGAVVYARPNNVAGLGNRCDNTEFQTFYPDEEKHSALASISFDPGGPVSFAVKAYYVNRKNLSDGGPLFLPAGATVTSANQFAAPILASIPGSPTSGTYLFNLAPALGNSTFQRTEMESWGITPTVKWDVGGGWQANAMFNYGIGKNVFTGQILNGTPITTAIAANAFDPFNLRNPINAAALTAAQDQFAYGRAQHDLVNARLIVDGPLFSLPAGQVKAALGVEYLYEKYKGNNSRNLTAAGIAALVDREGSRDIWSLFGELNIPLMGEGSGPFHSFTITASGRYDKYSDFGSTFNPKIGVNIEPVEWLALRGNWGKAFQAPGISDLALSGATIANVLPIAVRNFTNPAVPATGARTILLAMAGTISPLQPQRAQTWSLGFDIKPAASGFAAGMTYYNIDFKGVIALLPISDPPTYYRDFPTSSVLFPAGNAALQTFYNSFNAANASAALAQIGGTFDSVYGVLDARTQNLARIKTSGLDFYARYTHETGFGRIYGDISGTRILSFDRQSGPVSALVDQLSLNTTKLRTSVTLGAEAGNLRGQITWNHSQGFNVVPTASSLNQDKIASFNVFNLFFQYKVPGDSAIAKDLAFTLNVDNLFDQDPPLFRGPDGTFFGVKNGFTIGRFIKLGVSKKF